MTREPRDPDDEPAAVESASPIAVISAYGAFRLLLGLLAFWSFVEGFALLSGSFDALSYGGGSARAAERVVGAQMIVFAPIFGLIAWRRERHRLLIWVPYAAQLAIIIPGVFSFPDGALLLIVSSVFFVMLFYFWWHSHPLDYFADDDEDADEETDEQDDEDPDDDEADDDAPVTRPTRRGASAPPAPKARSGRFRRRDS